MSSRVNFYKPEWCDAHQQFAFSQAVKIGDTVYISGTTSCAEGFVPEHAGDFRAQFGNAYAKIQETLGHFGLGMNHVVKEIMFTRDMAALVANMDVRKGFYGAGPFPAATAVEIAQLFFPELLIEIEIVALDRRD